MKLSRFISLNVFTVLIVASVFALAACGTFNQKSYRAMGVMAATYDVGMKTATDLRAKGLISDEGRQTILDAAKPYAKAHNESVDAFVAYLQAEGDVEEENLKQQYITASRVALSAFSAIMEVLAKFGFNGEPVEPWF